MQIPLPGTPFVLSYSRGEDQRVLSIAGGGRTYLRDVDGRRVFDDGFVSMHEMPVSRGRVRRVEALGTSWVEEYLRDATGFASDIDGVRIRRDERRRIIACLGPASEWLYAYSGDALSIIDGPHGTRRISRTADGRPVVLNGHTLPYDGGGARRDIAPLPVTHHRDEFGRLWTITSGDGRVLTTYLWDGFACLARIDGPPGDPLAAVFSLDESRTPVRIILRDRVVRVPRDAFGESLLTHAGVPGLHGGAIHDGYMHYRSRALDPRCGSYDRPDPLDGSAADPRRRTGFQGELAVEKARTGPYAVCQYDPISYVDPTGEHTALLLLSDFTWSLQHNLAGWFGLDFTLNWWIDFFGAPAGLLGRFFEFEGFHSERTGRFGTRRGGVFSTDRVFTYQHQLFGSEAAFADLRQTSVVDPRGRFEPSQYGTILHVDPDGAAPFVLQGNLDAQAMPATSPWTWTRAGGPAEAVAPGLPAAYFPSGGIHLDNVFRSLLGPFDAALTELRPTDDAPAVATISQTRAFVDTAAVVSGIAAGDEVLLTDAATGADIKQVATVTAQGSGSRVRFTDGALTIAAAGVRIRGLGAAQGPETLTPVGPVGRLSTAGTTLSFVVNDALRLTQSAAVVGAAVVRSLEVQLQTDGALPAPPAAAFPLDVRLASGTGTAVAATLNGNRLTQNGTNALPALNDMIELVGGGTTRAAIVLEETSATERRLDRVAGDLSPLGAAVTWRRITAGTSIGQASVVDAGATLTYAPAAVRTAPATNFVSLTGAGASGYRAVRQVTGVAYDAIVLGNAAPPGNAAAAYQVERLPIDAPDIANATSGTEAALVLPPGVTLTGTALQLWQLNNTVVDLPASPLIANATLNGATATLTGTPGATPNPSDLVVLRDSGTSALELAIVARVLIPVTFDRAVNITGPDVRVVPLAPSGFVYNATRNDIFSVTVLPTANGTSPVQMPRIRAGEIVLVSGTGIATPLLYRVSAIAGTTLTLEDDAPIPALATALTVQRMLPSAPTFTPAGAATPQPTGVPWLGVEGTGSANQFTFRTWLPNAFQGVTTCGVTIRDPNNRLVDVTHPARFASAAAPQIVFTAAPGTVGANISINRPNLAAGGNPLYAAWFSQTGVDLRLGPTVPAAPSGANLLVAVPYESTGVTANARVTSGNVLCPNDPENWEFDRRQSLAEHELTHTCQSATWGPLYMGFLPLFALELASELGTDVELPEFSPYVDAQLEVVEGQNFLRIPDFHDIDFDAGVRVQISSTRFTPKTVTLGPRGQNADQNRFLLFRDLSLTAGPASARRQVGDNFWTGARDVLYNLLHILTLGGVTNLVAGGVWGGLIFGIGKLWHFMSRRWFGMGQSYPATVADDGRTVRMTTDEGRGAVIGFNEIILRTSSDSARRDVESLTGDTLRIKESVAFRGELQVVPYKAEDISDWHDYYDAHVPDAARPAAVRIDPRNGETLTLDPFDRVTIAQGVTTFRTNVMAVSAAGLVELERAPTSTPFRIAKVDENDPIGSADSRHLTEMGVGWMRWLFDPYAQFQFALDPARNSWQDIVARIARYGFSSHSWSAAIPGSLIFMNMLDQPNDGHRSPFEQDASNESGNLYSPLAKLRGGFVEQKEPFARYNATVGDVARYWHVPLHDTVDGAGLRVPTVVMNLNLRDSPGTHLQPLVRVIPVPNATPSGTVTPGSNGNEPNTGTNSSDPNPGRFVPDALTDKNTLTTGSPDATTQTGPASFAPNDLAFIPTSAALNQTVGSYASFTRPGLHRLTIQDGGTKNAEAREAQQLEVQTVWFDINVSDVIVTVAAQPVATQDPPASVTMVLLQRADVVVAPLIGQQYALTLTRPGSVLDTDSQALVAGATTGTETVEVSRLYAFSAGAFTDAVLAQHGMHLPGDLHVPVRQFSVTVVNTIVLRDAAEPAAAVLTSASPGQAAFLLVPVATDAPPTVAIAYPGGATPGIRDPQITTPTATPSDTARAFLGAAGVIFQVVLDDPPEETANLVLTTPVRSGAQTATLTSPLQMVPHFRIQHAAGTFRVQRGQTIELTCEGGVTAGNAACTGDGVQQVETTGSTIRIQFRPDATPGFRTVTCADANATTRLGRRTIEVTA